MLLDNMRHALQYRWTLVHKALPLTLVLPLRRCLCGAASDFGAQSAASDTKQLLSIAVKAGPPCTRRLDQARPYSYQARQRIHAWSSQTNDRFGNKETLDLTLKREMSNWAAPLGGLHLGLSL
jgi:hypothetical protein